MFWVQNVVDVHWSTRELFIPYPSYTHYNLNVVNIYIFTITSH